MTARASDQDPDAWAVGFEDIDDLLLASQVQENPRNGIITPLEEEILDEFLSENLPDTEDSILGCPDEPSLAYSSSATNQSEGSMPGKVQASHTDSGEPSVPQERRQASKPRTQGGTSQGCLPAGRDDTPRPPALPPRVATVQPSPWSLLSLGCCQTGVAADTDDRQDFPPGSVDVELHPADGELDVVIAPSLKLI
mmetsp:Transcript_81991/g.213516  ORF Transcript_81991/g.213516 Transcript_81991/m.213516 type:complete len:196 (+) Transcript_81991:60-647(+)